MRHSAVKQLITINHIQNKSFCLHYIYMCTVYIYYVYINTHRYSMNFENNLSVYIYIFIFLHFILYINIFNIYCKHNIFFLNIYMHVFVFIYTQYTHIYYVNKNVYLGCD